MDPFFRQLARLCRERPAAAKYVFVPSHALGHTIADRLVLEGASWANLRFRTPFDLALEIAAPTLVARDIDPVPDDIGPPLVMRLMLELSEQAPRYFRHLADQPPMAVALWSTIRELRMAGLGAAELRPEVFDDARKHGELRALLASFEGYLEQHRLADAAEVIRTATAHVAAGPVQAADVHLAMPGVIWSPVVRDFLAVLPSVALTAEPLAVPGLSPPRRMAESPVEARALDDEASMSDAGRLRFMMRPELAPPARGDGSLTMFRAGGRDAEIEEAFRRIASRGLALDTVEIACPSPDYVLLCWQKAMRYAWPVTVGPGLSLAVTKPARAVFGLCDWIESGYPATRLRRLLQSGDLSLASDDGPSSGQAARLLARAGATWGRRTYGSALRAYASAERMRSDDLEVDDAARARSTTRQRHALWLADWIEQLLEQLPDTDEDGATVWLDYLVTGVRSFVERHARRTSALDEAGASAIVDALEGLKVLSGVSRPLSVALKVVRATLEPVTVGSDRARPGHLHVTLLARSGFAGRPHSFVVGLEEGGVFPASVEDAVLLDVERERLHGGLATSSDRATEAVHQTVSRLASLGTVSGGWASLAPTQRTVCLSYSCRDLRQYRETFPSWLLLQVHRLGRQEDVTYAELVRDLGEPTSAVPPTPDEALSDGAWWLSHVLADRREVRTALLAAFRALAAGVAAEQARASPLFTSFDGFVPAAGLELDPRASGRVMSATRLEQLAACPFRHFLEFGLRLQAIDERVADRDVWLDPLTRGAELHALYALMMRRLRAERRPAQPDRDAPWLCARADERLDRLRLEAPPPSEGVFERERARLLHDLELFVTLEAERTEATGVAFEVGFGHVDPGPEPEALAHAKPVRIAVGSTGFWLRGRIDRLDRRADGTYEVVDYKTGSMIRSLYEGTFRGGRLLQHALYGVAASALLERHARASPVVSGTYYFPSARGGGHREAKPSPSPLELELVLGALLDTVAAGAFVHTPEPEDCRFCEYQAACDEPRWANAARKLARSDTEALAPFRRLRALD